MRQVERLREWKGWLVGVDGVGEVEASHHEAAENGCGDLHV